MESAATQPELASIKAQQAQDSLKDAEIQTKTEQITVLQQRIEQLQTEIQTQATLLESKNSEIQSKAQEITTLQQKLNAEGDQHLTQIQPLLSSNESWICVSRSEIKKLSKKQVGFGAWGMVYSAKFKGENVAIKIAHQEILHQSTVDMLKREVAIMAHIQHPNLVRFIGVVWDNAVERKVDAPIIISELMDMNLRAAYKDVDLSKNLISIFCDVAYALHYLHQHRQPIIHRDISAPNVLLKSSPPGFFRAKVSDFGSANLVKQSKTAGAGAIVYCAPEMFPNEDITVPPQPQTTKVDVFSYGILLLEVLSKEMPTQEIRYAMLQKVRREWYELIVHCTKPSPSDRPTMADILRRLNSIPH